MSINVCVHRKLFLGLSPAAHVAGWVWPVPCTGCVSARRTRTSCLSHSWDRARTPLGRGRAGRQACAGTDGSNSQNCFLVLALPVFSQLGTREREEAVHRSFKVGLQGQPWELSLGDSSSVSVGSVACMRAGRSRGRP